LSRLNDQCLEKFKGSETEWNPAELKEILAKNLTILHVDLPVFENILEMMNGWEYSIKKKTLAALSLSCHYLHMVIQPRLKLLKRTAKPQTEITSSSYSADATPFYHYHSSFRHSNHRRSRKKKPNCLHCPTHCP